MVILTYPTKGWGQTSTRTFMPCMVRGTTQQEGGPYYHCHILLHTNLLASALALLRPFGSPVINGHPTLHGQCSIGKHGGRTIQRAIQIYSTKGWGKQALAGPSMLCMVGGTNQQEGRPQCHKPFCFQQFLDAFFFGPGMVWTFLVTAI